MKTHKSLTLAVTLATTSLVGLMTGQADALEIGTEAPKGYKALQSGDWQAAHTIFDAITKSLTEDEGKLRYGGVFGELFYNKGYCELQLAALAKRKGGAENIKKANELYAQAAESFAACYRFPSDATSANKREKSCLLKHADALQALNDYASAIQKYEKYAAEGKPKAAELAMLHVNLAVCCFKLEQPDITRGIKFFETALQNKERWKTQDTAVVIAFQALTEAAIKAKNEQALIDFLNQNRSSLVLKPYQMVPFIPFYKNLGAQAFSAGMLNAGFNIFALIPDSEIAESDVKRMVIALSGYPEAVVTDGTEKIVKANLEKLLAQLKKQNSAGDPPEVYSLTALAYTYEANGYKRGALAAYEQLVLHFSKSQKREEHLYNLVRTASLVGDVPKAVKYGQIFIKEFPASKHSSFASTMMLSNLFSQGEYARVEELAAGMIGTLTKPSDTHDFCLHVLGGSKFYLRKYKEAKALLEEHVKTYPESVSKVAAAYFEASNLGRLKLKEQAAEKLDGFIKAYPVAAENPYLSYALYDRARMFYADNALDAAKKLIERIELDFADSSIGDSSRVLAGDIELKAKERELAKVAYVKAYEQAKSHANRGVASESLFKLVRLLGAEKIDKKENPAIKDAVPFYDLFWKGYQDSPFKTQLAIVGVPALVADGRSDEALTNLQSAIGELSKKEEALGLEKAIASYSKYFVLAQQAKGKDEVDSTDALAEEYYSFAGVAEDDIRTRAILEIEIIKMYEKGLTAAVKTKNDALVTKNKGRIAAAFKKLKTNYPVEQLTVKSLIKIADYLRSKSASPRQALPYYEERLKRPEKKGLGDVQFGIADVYSKAGNKAELEKAIAMMEKVLRDHPDDKEIVDQALSLIVEVNSKQENWQKVVDQASVYLKNNDNRQSRTRVTQLLANAYDKLGMYTQCIATNIAITGSSTAWEVTVPALDRATELMWENGEAVEGKSKQQVAYDFAYKYIKSSRAAFEANKIEMPLEVREAWLRIDKRVSDWESKFSDIIEVKSEQGSN